MPVIAFPGFVVVTQHARAADDEREAILETMCRAPDGPRNTPNDELGKPLQRQGGSCPSGGGARMAGGRIGILAPISLENGRRRQQAIAGPNPASVQAGGALT